MDSQVWFEYDWQLYTGCIIWKRVNKLIKYSELAVCAVFVVYVAVRFTESKAIDPVPGLS